MQILQYHLFEYVSFFLRSLNNTPFRDTLLNCKWENSKADLSSMTAPQLSVDTVDKSASNNIISEDAENTTSPYAI